MNTTIRLAATVILAAATQFANEVHAVRIMTNPATAPGDPNLSFDSFALTPDGTTLVTVGTLDGSLTGDFIYSLPVPANPAVDTVNVTPIIVDDFSTFDADGPAVISPDGTTVLYLNDRDAEGLNTIRTTPVTGGAAPSNGLFNTSPNTVAPGNSNFGPRYSADGSKIYFINGNAGFQGSIPDFDVPDVISFASAPQWDTLWVANADGSNPTAVSQPGDGDFDTGLYDFTPDGSTIIYAPDKPAATRSSINNRNNVIRSISSTGGAFTDIPISSVANSQFDIENRLRVTSDGANILFIADLDTPGQDELYSLPIAGGTPTKISDTLALAGDVHSFDISPDGTSVSYIAGQNSGASNEVFLKSLAGAAGSSVRISDPHSANNGEFDASVLGNGSVQFAPDGQSVYYLADSLQQDVFDFYVVDLTAKAGLTPSAFVFTGSAGGDFFDESNWTDSDGNNPPMDTINPGTPIRHALVIDGDQVVGVTPGEADFQVGGSLEMTPGSSLTLDQPGAILDFNPESAFKFDNATLVVDDDIRLEGENFLTGGSITSTVDDIEFLRGHVSTIDGTTFSSGDNTFFFNNATRIENANFTSADRVGIQFESEVIIVDTTIAIQGGAGDLDDVFGGQDADQGIDDANSDDAILRLQGASELLADSIAEGVDVIVEDESRVVLNTLDTDVVSGNTGDMLPTFDGEPFSSTITLSSTDAELVLNGVSAVDYRTLLINGLTGLSYFDDPTAWNDPNWDGLSAIASLKLAGAAIDGDFDGDGDVDGSDFLAWQRGESPTPFSAGDLALWEGAYAGGGSLAAGQVPEPGAALLLAVGALALASFSRSRRE